MMAIITNNTEQTLVYPSLGVELAPGESFDDASDVVSEPAPKKASKNAAAAPASVDTATESTPAVTVENTSDVSETVADASAATPSA
jgi:hypothetical protein